MKKSEFLQLARQNPVLGVDYILRYNNPRWLGMADVHIGLHKTISKVKESIAKAKEGLIPWSDAKTIALIHLHRGCGKTTNLLGRILWELGNNPNHKIKIVCETDDNARKRVIFLQQQILYNKHLHELFPNLKPAENGLWNNLQLYVKRDIISVDPSIEGCGILSSSTGGRASILFCLDSTVEVLTKKGWKSGADLSSIDEVAVYDPKTGQTFFEKPLTHIVFNSEQPYYRFKTPYGVFKTTFDHKSIFKVKDKILIGSSDDFIRKFGFRFHGELLTSAISNNKLTVSEFFIKEGHESRKIKLIDLFWLLGVLVRCGRHAPDRVSFLIKVNTSNQYTFSELKNLLDKYNFWYKETPSGFIIDSIIIKKLFNKLVLAAKDITQFPFFNYLNKETAASFFDGFDINRELTYGITIPARELTHQKSFFPIIQLIGLFCGVSVVRTRHDVFVRLGMTTPVDIVVNQGSKKCIWWDIKVSTGFFIARSGDLVFITGNCDDPIGMKNAIIYPENAKKAQESFESNWLPMLEDDGFVVIAYTVWTENDFPYKLEQECTNCIKYIKLVDDNLNPVWPDKFPKEKLLEIKNKIGDTAFARGFQGRPGSTKDFIFNKEAIFRSINTEKRLGTKVEDGAYFIGVDLAISQKTSGKRSAIVVINSNNGQRKIVDIVADKLSSVDTALTIINLTKKYNPLGIYVENNAYQQALIEWIEVIDTERITSGLIHGYFTGAQKFNPFHGLPALATEFTQGKWELFSTDHEYNDKCECPFCLAINEFITFPFGKTSDIVMATFFAREAAKDILGESDGCDIKFLVLDNDIN